MVEGRLRTLETLATQAKGMTFLCLVRPWQSPVATSTRSLHYLLWGGKMCCCDFHVPKATLL